MYGLPSAWLVPLPVGLARSPSLQRGPTRLAGTEPPNRALLQDGPAPALGAVHTAEKARELGKRATMHAADEHGPGEGPRDAACDLGGLER
jgi:hypothetical protein